MPKIAAYGSWKSPIDTDLITSAAPRLDQPQQDGDCLYWLETRPWQDGRNVVMRRRADGTIEDVLPAPLSARSRVHEYGGAPYLVAAGVLYFCMEHNQRIYRLDLTIADALPQPLTPEANRRYADLSIDIARQRLIASCEEHADKQRLPANFIVAIPLNASQQITTLVSGADFYANARISPCTNKISWLCWQHPNMPWDETELWVADCSAEGLPSNARLMVGGTMLGAPESIFQPQWHADGSLYFASDRSNWWQLYRLDKHGHVQPVISTGDANTDKAEFAMPQWLFGMSTFGFVNSASIVCSYTQNGFWNLAIIDIASGKLTQIPSQYTSIQALTCRSNHAYFIGAAATLAAQVAEFDLAGESLTPAYKSGELPIASTYLARPETIQFPSGNATAHAFLYSPCNPDFSAPADSKPPLMVICHGGPTAACDSALNLKIQFWSSRGFAVLDVNYRGSSGYGRAYRDALKGQWGVVDVEDAINGARYLADKGQVNPQQMAIRGSSAGGFTVLSALTCHDTFKAGASLYGIGDLELLVADTHKFEAHYTDTLVGPYPQKKALYQQRSPINHIDALSCPVIFLQGLDDKVVPPKQAELMVAALRNKNIPVAYLSFAGEGHGFKKADNIKKALQAELYFYSRVFGFVLSEAVPAITIDNLVN